jgi:hypothetical protein
VIDRAFEHPLEIEEKAAAPFAGGIVQHGYQCGMIWGATLAAGAEAYRRFGPTAEGEAKAIRAARRVLDAFRTRHGEINCFEITHIDKDSSSWEMINFFLIKGGTIGCFKMASWFAPLAYEEINTAFSEGVGRAEESEGAGKAKEAEVEDGGLPPPVSCAAKLARSLGRSEEQALMVSGLAGGIGLCGGACGALGAAIWFLSMNIAEEKLKDGKVRYEDYVRDPRTQEVVDRFLKSSDYRFECSEIVGREFESVGDHAAYLRGGGCSELLEALAGDMGSASEEEAP